MPNPIEFECVCGHVDEEHEKGFFRSCTLCDCDDFEPIEDNEYDPEDDE